MMEIKMISLVRNAKFKNNVEPLSMNAFMSPAVIGNSGENQISGLIKIHNPRIGDR